MKRKLSIFLVLMMILGLLSGCGGASKFESAIAMDAPAAQADMAVTEEVLYDETASGTDDGATALPTDQKLIRTVYMDAETQSMDALMPWIEGRVADLGGYFERKSIRRSGSRDDGSYYKYADLMVRIPSENLDQFISQVGDNANITSTTEETENVTLQYVSTQSRVQALETEQKRLLELLEGAENMEDLLTIEARLTEVRWELENYASQLRVLDNQVTYSTVYLDIREVDKPTVVAERTVWQKIGDGFSENAGDMWDGLVNFFIWVITVIPYLIPLSLITGAVLLVITLLKKLKMRRKAKKNSASAEEK